MSATTPEGKVKAKIDAILKPYKASGRLWYTKTAGSMFGKNGVPDYVCHLLAVRMPPRSQEENEFPSYARTFFTIEAKAGKGKASDLQEAQMKDIRAAGGVTLVINETNLQELQEFLSAHS